MPVDAPRETSQIWTTPEHFGQDTDKPQNRVDSDNDEEEDEDEDADGTVNWSKQNSYTFPSIDRHSLSSGSSRSHTETGTVRGWALSLGIPNVSSGDSLNDDTLVDTTNSAEPEDEEDELEERRVSIGFSGTRYQTTSFDLDAFRASAIFVQQRRHSRAPTTFPTVVDPPSPLPSALRLDTQDVKYDSTWSDDSDGKSSRRTSLLSEDLGDPRSEYQELEFVNTQPPLRDEFQLVCAVAFVRSHLNPDWLCFPRLFRRLLPSLQTGQAKEDREDSLPVHKTPIPIPVPRDRPMNQNQNKQSTHPYASLNTTEATPSMLTFHPNTHLPTRTTTNSLGSSQSRRSRLNPPLQTKKSRPFKRGSAFTRRSHWSRRS